MDKRLDAYFDSVKSASELSGEQKWILENGDGIDRDLFEKFMACDTGDFPASQSAFREVSEMLRIRVTAIDGSAKRAVLTAAAAIAFFFLGVFLARRDDGETYEEWAEIVVPAGHTRAITLSDGTVIHLNSGSRLTYPVKFSGAERKIFFEGEILLDVAKDEEHPFIVNAGETSVYVTGTRFTYKYYQESSYAEVFLYDGSVNFSVLSMDAENNVSLRPGNYVLFDKQRGSLELMDFHGGLKTFVDNGALHFFNVSLRDIATELEHRGKQQIVIESESLAEKKYLAFFSNGESNMEVLEVLNAEDRMAIRQVGNIIYVSEK